MLGRARLGLLDRPTAHKGETTQPSTEPRVECERELIREKCSICKTKILFGVLCLKCRRNYCLVVFLLLNASNKRRPDKGVRWRPKAGTNLIALLGGWTFTTPSIRWHIGKFARRRESFLKSEGIRGWATLSQNFKSLRCLFD